jgi:hypothetical protein
MLTQDRITGKLDRKGAIAEFCGWKYTCEQICQRVMCGGTGGHALGWVREDEEKSRPESQRQVGASLFTFSCPCCRSKFKIRITDAALATTKDEDEMTLLSHCGYQTGCIQYACFKEGVKAALVHARKKAQ